MYTYISPLFSQELAAQKNAAEARAEDLQRRVMEVDGTLTSQIRHLTDSNRKVCHTHVCVRETPKSLVVCVCVFVCVCVCVCVCV